jgi:hypothetical protein
VKEFFTAWIYGSIALVVGSDVRRRAEVRSYVLFFAEEAHGELGPRLAALSPEE